MSALSRLIGTTVRCSLRGEGRAPRREFIAFLVMSQIPVALADWLGGWLAPDPARAWLLFGVQALVFLPVPALLVRRLHDVGLSGRWSWILLALAIRAFALALLGLLGGEALRDPVESLLSWIDWTLYLPAFALYVLLLAMPGSKGTNRFGPDPREVTAGTNETAGRDEPTPAD